MARLACPTARSYSKSAAVLQAPDNDVGIHLPAKIYGQTEIRFYRHPIGIFKSLSNQTNTTIRIEKFLLNGIDTDSNNNLIEQFQAPSYDLFMPDRKGSKDPGNTAIFSIVE